jgi:hypothetical protein
MTEMIAVQVHCPFCNGIQSAQGSGEYVCEFCLQPFSLVAAQKEESRVVEEIKRWLDQKVGAGGMSSESVDVASRSFIFGQRMLPDLKRDVDRALEMLGGYGQHGLVRLPIAASSASKTANPLIASRSSILGLKDLRARLSSPQVSAFAAGDDQKTAVQALDRRLAEITYLSNVVEASSKGGAQGYAGAKRNLLSLLEDVAEALLSPGSDAPLRQYLAGLQARYRSLVELCSICETLTAGGFEASQLAERLGRVEDDLRAAAAQIKDSDHSPADSVPVAMGTAYEADGCRLLGRWLASYADLAPSGSISFDEFRAFAESLCRPQMSAEAKADLVDTWSQALAARTRRAPVPAYDDFSWLDPAIEASRAKKTFGFLGNEERVVDVQRFLLPVWLGSVSYSKSSGTVFKEGVEGKCLVIANACAPSTAGVTFIDPQSPMFDSLRTPRQLPAVDIALPQSARGETTAIVLQAARSRADLLNSQVKIESLAFVAAAFVTYESKAGRRTAAFTNGASLALDPGTATYIHAARKAAQILH